MQSISGVLQFPKDEARNLTCSLMQEVRGMKQSFIASALGIDESGVSRMLSGEIGIKFEKLDALIDAMGMKLVAKDVVVVPAKELDSLRYLVGIYCEKRRGEK